MKTRIISGLVAIALFCVIVYLGSPVFNIMILALTLIGLYEYKKAVSIIMDRKLPMVINTIFAITLFLLKFFTLERFITLTIFVYLLLSFCEFVIDSEVKTKDLALSVLGGLYVVFLMSYLYNFADGYKIWYVILIASGSDTFAYFTGRAIGKHKLAPVLSPKKTVEGLIGGIVGGILLGVLFAAKFDPSYKLEVGIMAAVVSVISVFGDIFASKIKRETGIKDYGKLMPGHGGVLDRFDSILFAAPIVYYFARFFMV